MKTVSLDKTGVFSMEVVHQILKAQSLADAQTLAKDAIATVVTDGKKVREENIKKAQSMIENSKTLKNLALGMSNFILAFQGEKVVKLK